jgi:hypothetical protein
VLELALNAGTLLRFSSLPFIVKERVLVSLAALIDEF